MSNRVSIRVVSASLSRCQMSHLVAGIGLSVLCLFWPGPLSAGFVVNASDWNELSFEEKEFYIAGNLDGSLFITTEDEEWNQYLIDRNACIAEHAFESDDLVRSVDNYYETEPDSVDFPPTIVLHAVLRDFCKDAINKLRRSRGDDDLLK